MCFFDLVEQHHRVGASPHGLGELATLFVANVSRRRTNQARHRVFLAVLRHVDAHNRTLIIEEQFGKRLREFGFAHASGAEEHERSGGARGVAHPGTRPANRIRYRRDGRILPNDPLVKFAFEVEQLFALRLHELPHRNAGPGGNDLGNIGVGDVVVHHPTLARFGGFGLLQSRL